MNKSIKIILKLIDIPQIIKAYLQKILLRDRGEEVTIGHNCEFIYDHIHLGHHVHIGSNASFVSSISHIYIGNYVVFGPNVTIRGGNHRIDIIGKYIFNVDESQKTNENDKDVIIEDDVWIGCNVTILKGVTIQRGAVVAGSIVTKSVPPYAIVAGNPAKVIKYRFDAEQIVQHELTLKS